MKQLFLIFIFGFTSLMFAQIIDHNSETLALFNDENWNDLIKIGEKAFEDDQSSYEIEYRLAVAY